jgi:hypothetical protein
VQFCVQFCSVWKLAPTVGVGGAMSIGNTASPLQTAYAWPPSADNVSALRQPTRPPATGVDVDCWLAGMLTESR